MHSVLHIADFVLHAVLRTEDGLKPWQPAALFAGTSKKSVVLAANPAARAAGVELGMTAPQAIARCTKLIVRSPQSAAEAEARAVLLAVAFTLSPLIEDTAPGVCTADLKGGDAAHFSAAAESAVAELTRLGLPATAGIAATPLLALYAARAASAAPMAEVGGQTSDSRWQTAEARPPSSAFRPLSSVPCPPSPVSRPLSPVGCPPPSVLRHPSSAVRPPSSALGHPPSALRPPPSSAVLHVTDPAAFLAPLPLSAADPAPELAAILGNWGVRTLGDLTALPRDEIVRRFGAEGLALWQRAAGGAPRPLHPVAPPREFSASMELEHEVETLEPLLFILRRFLERLSLELTASQHVAAEIELRLPLADETTYTRRFRLPEPTADVEILFRTLHTHLESLTTAASIVAVQLQLTPARPLVRQQGLFESGLRDPHGFAETLARVSALVGADRIGTPQLPDTHRPDTVKLVTPPSVVPPSPPQPPPATRGRELVEGVHAPLGVPLRRFRPPLPARIEFTHDRVTYLWTEQIEGEVIHQSADWPSSGDWWQHDRAWARTEWDIALAGGGLYRLVLIGESYFLEGEYD